MTSIAMEFSRGCNGPHNRKHNMTVPFCIKWSKIVFITTIWWFDFDFEISLDVSSKCTVFLNLIISYKNTFWKKRFQDWSKRRRGRIRRRSGTGRHVRTSASQSAGSRQLDHGLGAQQNDWTRNPAERMPRRQRNQYGK